MIVEIIDVVCIAVHKAKGHAPVSRNPNRPMAFQFAFERMQPESRQVHVVRFRAVVQERKNVAQADDMLWRYALLGPSVIQGFETEMTETSGSSPEVSVSPVACQTTSPRPPAIAPLPRTAAVVLQMPDRAASCRAQA